jgi:3-hydroxybutyryl-CoA dehydratase
LRFPEAGDNYLEDLYVGQTAERRHVVTDDDIQTFAKLTGDYSPLHVDDEFARKSRFGRRLAHGMLTSSFITGIIGMELPARHGIYMGQTLSFRKPVFIGDEIVVKAAVSSIDHEKCRIKLSTVCMVGDQVVLEGESLIYVPRRPRPSDGKA